MVSAFNCFSSSAHDDDVENSFTRQYSPSVLPQLSASNRARTSPTRAPLLKRPSLRFDKKRPSYGSSGDGEKRALRKGMIGNPTGFQHVGGASLNEKLKSFSIPPRQLEMSQTKPLPLVITDSTTTRPPPPPPPRERPFSLPAPSRAPLADTLNRTLSPPSLSPTERVVRRQSLASPKRKPAPPVTPSLIQQVEGGGGGGGGGVQQTNSPNLLKVDEKPGTSLELDDLFSKSELRAIEKYEQVAEGKLSSSGSTMKPSRGGRESDWKGAMKEIELALASSKSAT